MRGCHAKVLVNDRADVALACGAHGIHLRSDSIAAPRIRALLGRDAVVGRSVHSADEASAVAKSGGLDYLVFGTLFPTPSKAGSERLATLDELTLACRASGLPVLAIGGMTIERAAAAVRAGAAGIAAIRLFVPPMDEPHDRYHQALVKSLRRTFDTCRGVS